MLQDVKKGPVCWCFNLTNNEPNQFGVKDFPYNQTLSDRRVVHIPQKGINEVSDFRTTPKSSRSGISSDLELAVTKFLRLNFPHKTHPKKNCRPHLWHFLLSLLYYRDLPNSSSSIAKQIIIIWLLSFMKYNCCVCL